ncbi:MAG: HAMP domain-containing histidine kinase, partial [Gammaproteobacteria bacterium]|nr:HAMP domain-containing histidine kinase [Gammaproteobacteria bacterium]
NNIHINIAKDIETNFSYIEVLLLKHLATENAKNMDDFSREIKMQTYALLHNLNLLKKHLNMHSNHKHVGEDIEQLESIVKSYLEQTKLSINESKNFEKENAFNIFHKVEIKYAQKIKDKLKNIILIASSELESSRSHVFNTMSLNHIITTGVSISFVIILLLIAFYKSKDVAARLETLLIWSNDFSNNINARLQVKERRDEIGKLSQAMLSMSDKISHSYAENNRMIKLVEEHNDLLEVRVKERTAELEDAQSQLIQSEKMVALGELVSGVAHEVNTPLGVGITAASHLEEEIKSFNKELNEGAIKKSTLTNFVNQLTEGLYILNTNLNRAAQLIKSFKQVAVDQSSDENRFLILHTYLEDVLSSLGPKWKHSQISVLTDFEAGIEIESNPGVLAQVITNLIDNAIKHAFDSDVYKGTKPQIHLKLSSLENEVLIEVKDNGVGMKAKTLEKVFDPFYTTKRGKGGSGLGMHIVYNLITQKLNGKIQCESELNQGTSFKILLPKK